MKGILSLFLVLAANFAFLSCQENHQFQQVTKEGEVNLLENGSENFELALAPAAQEERCGGGAELVIAHQNELEAAKLQCDQRISLCSLNSTKWQQQFGICNEKVDELENELLEERLRQRNELKAQKAFYENELEAAREKENATAAFYEEKLLQQAKLMESQLQNCQFEPSELAKSAPTSYEIEPNFQKLELETGTYFLSEAVVNWHAAARLCLMNGMSLVSIETKEETLALREALPLEVWFWSSGCDRGSEGSFYWASTSQPFGQYTDWFSLTEPNNVNGNENCVCIYKQDHFPGTLMWHDENCETKQRRFICEL